MCSCVRGVVCILWMANLGDGGQGQQDATGSPTPALHQPHLCGARAAFPSPKVLPQPLPLLLPPACPFPQSVKSGSLLHGPDGGLLRPVREFQNAVDRTPWRTATFSADSEHVIGATAAKAQLQLYIWNRPLGNMERILEGGWGQEGGDSWWARCGWKGRGRRQRRTTWNPGSLGVGWGAACWGCCRAQALQARLGAQELAVRLVCMCA